MERGGKVDRSAGRHGAATDETHATVRMAGLTIDSSPGRGVVIDTKYLTTGSAAVFLFDSIISA